MTRTGLCYVNPLRSGKSRFTDVHFVATKPYYAATNTSVSIVLGELGQRAKKQPGDEQFLHMLCKRCVGLPAKSEQWRPLWGFHLSNNRRHWTNLAAAWGCKEPHAKEHWDALKRSKAWQAARPHFDPVYLSTIETLEQLLRPC